MKINVLHYGTTKNRAVCSGLKTYTPLPLQVREPLQIISDHVVVFTSGTSHNDNTLVIGYLGYFLHRASGAHLDTKYTINDSLNIA